MKPREPPGAGRRGLGRQGGAGGRGRRACASASGAGRPGRGGGEPAGGDGGPPASPVPTHHSSSSRGRLARGEAVEEPRVRLRGGRRGAPFLERPPPPGTRGARLPRSARRGGGAGGERGIRTPRVHSLGLAWREGLSPSSVSGRSGELVEGEMEGAGGLGQTERG